MTETDSTHTPPRAARWMLFLPLAIGAVLVLIYWLVWSWAAGVMREEVDAWIVDQRDAGYTVEHGDVDVEGFPFVLRARLAEPVYGHDAERSGWLWSAEELYVDASPFNPDRLILSPGGGQTLVTEEPGSRKVWDLTADVFRISLASDRTGLDVRMLTARPAEGDNELRLVTIGNLIANTLLADNPESGRELDFGRLAISGKDIVLEQNAGERLAIVALDASFATTGVDALLNRQSGESSISAWQRGDGELVIEGLRMIVSDGNQAIPTQLTANGTLTIDDEAYPAGTVELTMKDHLALLSILAERDVISQREADQADEALRFLSDAMGEEIKAPLQLRGGKLRLGPVSILDLERVE